MKEKKTKPQTSLEKRKECSVNNSLRGDQARLPYALREDITSELKNRVNGENERTIEKKNDTRICQKTLGKFSDLFKNFTHTADRFDS
jgi:hypothetical protein